MIDYLKNLIVWLVNFLLKENINKKLLLTSILKHLNKCCKIMLTRGKAECIKYNKLYRLQFFKFMFNGFSLDNMNIKVPKSLKPLGEVFSGEQ